MRISNFIKFFIIWLVWGLIGALSVLMFLEGIKYNVYYSVSQQRDNATDTNNNFIWSSTLVSKQERSWKVEPAIQDETIIEKWYEQEFFSDYCDNVNFDCISTVFDKLAFSWKLTYNLCNNFDDLLIRNNCFYMLARQELNTQICNYIQNDPILINICIDQVKIFGRDNISDVRECFRDNIEDVPSCVMDVFNKKQFRLSFKDCSNLENLIAENKRDKNIALNCWDRAIQYNAYLKQLNKCDMINSRLFPSDKLRQKCKLEYGIQNWCDKLDGSLKTQCQLLEAQRLLNNQF